MYTREQKGEWEMLVPSKVRPDWYGRLARGPFKFTRAGLWHAWNSGQIVPYEGFHIEPRGYGGLVVIMLLVLFASYSWYRFLVP
jgi:hypothetical protein